MGGFHDANSRYLQQNGLGQHFQLLGRLVLLVMVCVVMGGNSASTGDACKISTHLEAGTDDSFGARGLSKWQSTRPWVVLFVASVACSGLQAVSSHPDENKH